MIVHGFVVTNAVQCELIARMMREPFQCIDIYESARREGVPFERDIALRLADRLIQRERKAGHIVRAGRAWRWADGHQ